MSTHRTGVEGGVGQEGISQQTEVYEVRFPPLCSGELHPALDALRPYVTFAGRVRRALTPRQKHWYHASLHVAVNGLMTTPIPAGAFTFDMTLDLLRHELVVATSRGEQQRLPLHGQSAAESCADGLGLLAGLGIEPEIDRTLFADTRAVPYDAPTVQGYFQALSQVDTVLKRFKGELREETSPVQFWAHNMDLALLWFSGRLVPGVDPADEENADEQMTFGFSPGDDAIPEPYFYVTAYPRSDGFAETALPGDAFWHSGGFTGAIMMYASLVEAGDPVDKALAFFLTVQQAGADLMR